MRPIRQNKNRATAFVRPYATALRCPCATAFIRALVFFGPNIKLIGQEKVAGHIFGHLFEINLSPKTEAGLSAASTSYEGGLNQILN